MRVFTYNFHLRRNRLRCVISHRVLSRIEMNLFVFLVRADRSLLHTPRDVHIGRRRRVGALAVVVAVPPEGAMLNGHDAQVSVGERVSRLNELPRTERGSVPKVSAAAAGSEADCRNSIHPSSATISKVFSHWSTGSRKGRGGQLSQTLDPAITQSVLMNTYSAANHDIHTLAARNGNTIVFKKIIFIFPI